MIAVLPILLYPLLGMSMFQISQFMQEQPTRVLVVGAKDLADLPPLFENQQFAGRLFTDPSRTKLLELHFAPDEPPAQRAKRRDSTAQGRSPSPGAGRPVRGGALFSARLRQPARRLPRGHPPPGREQLPSPPGEGQGVRAE